MSILRISLVGFKLPKRHVVHPFFLLGKPQYVTPHLTSLDEESPNLIGNHWDLSYVLRLQTNRAPTSDRGFPGNR